MMPALSDLTGPVEPVLDSPLPGIPFVRSRRAAAIVFALVGLVVSIAALAYLLGRMASSAQAGTSPAKLAKAEQFIVVDAPSGAPVKGTVQPPAPVPAPPTTKPIAPNSPEALPRSAPAALPAASIATPQAPTAARVASPPVTQPAPAVSKPSPSGPPSPAPPANNVAAATTPTLSGEFLQVAAVDRGMAQVSVEYLMQRGLPARIGDSPTPGVFRVLVGPISGAMQSDPTKAKLEELGFRPFVRKF